MIHVAEAAHILSASDKGPRSNPAVDAARRAEYENLLLLCPTCHTIVDKAEVDYPTDLLVGWKTSHRERTAGTFGVPRYEERSQAREAIDQFLVENRTVWEDFGPEAGYQFDPESPLAPLWRRHVVSTIIPNNRLVVRVLEQNTHLLSDAERRTLARMRVHVDDLEARHLHDHPQGSATRFPVEMDQILIEASE